MDNKIQKTEVTENMKTKLLEKYYSRREIAEKFSVDTGTIYRWELRGLLTPIRVNSRVIRYRESEVLALVKSWTD